MQKKIKDHIFRDLCHLSLLPAVADDVDAQRRHLEVLAVVDARRHCAVLLAERVDGAHALRLIRFSRFTV